MRRSGGESRGILRGCLTFVVPKLRYHHRRRVSNNSGGSRRWNGILTYKIILRNLPRSAFSAQQAAAFRVVVLSLSALPFRFFFLLVFLPFILVVYLPLPPISYRNTTPCPHTFKMASVSPPPELPAVVSESDPLDSWDNEDEPSVTTPEDEVSRFSHI